ncbi:MAG: UDP-N-acetylmuramoyl-L-alanyl-D-glutamate--2,6-diaminopimelate ligase [candidate division WOR-3 bacterium]
MAKLLEELISDLSVNKILGDKKITITGIAYHSQKVRPNYLFVALEGSKTSGIQFIEEALAKGAVAIASNQIIPNWNNKATYLQVAEPRIFLAQVANKFYNFPTQRIKLIGVTGTNGKTTTAYLIKSILDTAGKTSGLLGTIKHFDGENWLKAENTTPESLDIIQILTKLEHKGINYCVLEVSSHGLELHRVFGLRFSVGVFTNLTQDHLDFHKTIEAYKNAKLKLFAGLDKKAIAIVNRDDDLAYEIDQISQARIIYYSLKNPAEITAKILDLTPLGTKLILNSEGTEVAMNLRLPGTPNVYNLLAAAGVGLALGISLATIKTGIEKVKFIPGRLERVENDKGLLVFVDYAHSPDALKNLLMTARAFTKKRVLILFGCGGNRDKTKRPIMGRIATELADFVVLTSDNPRDEDPQKIIEDIKTGITKSNFEVVPDRYRAIKRILTLAQMGDIVLIAGKGHEDYQIIGNEKRHFDDKQVVKQILES